MAYCTQDDLLKMISRIELAQLTCEAGDEPDTQVVAWAAAQAGGEIDSYLGERYQLPLSEVPPQVQALAVDMALYHLFTRRGVVPQARRQKYAAALDFLKEVAAGRAVLAGTTGEPPRFSPLAPEISAAGRLFSRNGQKEW
jgi:phage gp36-like protein